MQYDNCVGGANRDWCMSNLGYALGALQAESEYARQAFEAKLCSDYASRDFRWLYQCISTENAGVDREPWRAASCADADKLNHAQCQAVLNEFRDNTACPLPSSQVWNAESAASYQCE